MAATFDFTTFFTQAFLKVAPFYTAWLFCMDNNYKEKFGILSSIRKLKQGTLILPNSVMDID